MKTGKRIVMLLTLALILGVIWPAGSAMVSAKESEVRADEDAPYTVEFTYDDSEFVMAGDSSASLREILDFLGLEGEIGSVSVSNEKLFSAEDKNGEWIVTARQPFSSAEWMKVVLDGREYEIAVTDEYKIYYYNPVTGVRDWKADTSCNDVSTQDIWGLDYQWNGFPYTWYVVKEDYTFTRRVLITANVNLIICDGATLTCEKGISVGNEGSLTIWAQSSENKGKLVCSADGDRAAIGSDIEWDAGPITINGCEISATGAAKAAAIGGGTGQWAKSITINGGKITATAGKDGAAIGGGKGAGTASGTITINGGDITPIGNQGASIGSGAHSGGIDIIINGGNINSTSCFGANIGSGYDGDFGNKTITINGGVLNLKNEVGGAGIGGGENSKGGKVVINNGTITTSCSNGAGIGGGRDGEAPAIIINNGTIKANLDKEDLTSAGIGLGYSEGNGHTVEMILINGGNIYAKGGINSAGIGAVTGNGANITITGGIVYAYGGRYGAGIGSGDSTTPEPVNIHISGGEIHAFGGYNAAGIGNRTGGNVTTALSYVNATRDSISIESSSYNGSVTIADGCMFSVGTGTIYTGKLTDKQIKDIAGKTLKYEPKAFYLDENGKVSNPVEGEEVKGNTTTFTGSNGKDGWYVVSGNVTISDLVTVTGDVKLILCDGATLTTTSGINVREGNSLKIYAQSTGDKKGKLITTGSKEQAGIGSGIYIGSDHKRVLVCSGNIEIYGGDISATGGEGAAGIGGGGNCSGGTTVLGGGTISATGGTGAAGIGGGARSRAGKIHVTGTVVLKDVKAGMGTDNIAIGTGDSGSFVATVGDTITIDGGTIQGVSKIGGKYCSIVFDHNNSNTSLPSVKADAYVGDVTFRQTFVDNSSADGKKVFVPGNAKDNYELIEQLKGTTLKPGTGYAITVDKGITNGGVTAENLYQAAQPGDKVTLIATPAQDFALHEITVKDADGREVSFQRSDNVITFTMPNGTVSVWAKFKVANAINYIDPTKSGSERIQYQDDYALLTNQTKLETGWYAVRGDVRIGDQTSDRIVIDGNVNLILCDGATLTAVRGVTVEAGNGLTIWAQSEGAGAGTLIAGEVYDGSAFVEYGAAGLGSREYKSAGDITINGGNVIATGASSGAGIGSGRWYVNVGTITINGGVVTAVGGERAAGIGGGYGCCKGGKVLINGGVVNATGGTDKDYGESGAGIGGGFESEGIEVIITGGKINAVGGTGSAGIGAGQDGTGTTVTIGSSAETAESMSVKADSYDGTVKLLCGFKDANDGTLFGKTEDANKSALAGRTLVPADYYHVNVATGIQNGSVNAPMVAEKGTSVTVTVEAEEHYELKSLTVTAGTTTVDAAKVDENTYTFTMPEGDATVSAEFQKMKYVITFLNEDGSELYSSEVTYGEMPVYAGKEPKKEATQQYSYKFKAWDAELEAVAGTATYTATYEDILNKYEIQFVDENGNVLQSSEVEYGKMPKFEGTIPDKAETNQYKYEFDGWDKELEAVTDKATYKVTYKEILRKYVITFQDDNGSELFSSEVEYGTVPAYASVTPVKGSTDENMYPFKGWSPAVTAVTGEATYSATYNTVKRKYFITFVNEDGTVLQSTEIAYGEVPVYAGETPKKTATTEKTFVFQGWDKNVVAVTGTAVYTATFADSTNSYKITWLLDDGSLIDETTVEYGKVPTHADATKEATAEFSYTFTGWDKTPVKVTGDTTYVATFNETKNSYKITWQMDDGSLIDETTVEYGEVPAHADATKKATAEYTYTFTGWDKAPVAVTGEATYKATFSKAKNSYKITWQMDDGSLIDETTVEYGEIPVHESVTKKATAEKTYVFSGWTPSVKAVVGEAEYKAVFSDSVNSYKITWLMDDGSLIDETTVEYGEVPTHADAVKKNTAEHNYIFTGWDKAPVAVTGEATYKATFGELTNGYKITWLMDDGSLIDETIVEYGEVPTHADAVKAETADYTYTFTGWDVTPAAVTGEATYKATFKENKKDSGGSTTVVTNEYGDYLDELRERLRYAIALGGEQSVYWNKGTSLPKDILKTLEDHPDITLIFDYVYENEKYSVTMPGKIVKTVEGVEWYGPVYLYCTYGKAEAEVATSEISGIYVVKSGDTLSRIARKLHVKQKYLVDVNKIKNPDFIRAGQVLKY
ncbi:MAG: LysM peptidoglycan-binding domain-containing protein [Lachnospiraceae bacterium]|nr:LysM peptidoglycan-binding domain-containing protein [Lachnospiraceae bacterium]